MRVLSAVAAAALFALPFACAGAASATPSAEGLKALPGIELVAAKKKATVDEATKPVKKHKRHIKKHHMKKHHVKKHHVKKHHMAKKPVAAKKPAKT